jgi:hypothetical protein
MIIVSRFNEDVSWIKDYPIPHLIYNKGEDLDSSFNSMRLPNIGGNQYDIFHFAYHNYENLPEATIFLQGNPFDHCNKEKLDKIILNKYFTAIESYENITPSPACRLSEDGGYMEINNSWYVNAHNSSYNQTCKYSTLDDFMNSKFVGYIRPDWVRFTPGSQYIIEDKQILNYTKDFWYSLMSELYRHNMTEGHIIERALFMILTEKYEVRNVR